MQIQGAMVVPSPGWGFRLMTTVTLTAGTIFLMWLGEQISERGIGNGISLLIFAGIIVRLPEAILASWTLITQGEMNPLVFLLLLVLMVAVVAGVILMTLGAAAHPGAVCEAGGRPPGLWRAEHPHSAPGQHGGCHPGHLRQFHHRVSRHGGAVHRPPLGATR